MSTKELSVLFGVISIVAMLIIPLPPLLISFLILINISIALLILLVSMNVREVLDFSVFPTLLLIMTLFRLGLNVSTTRAILGEGHAGGVVETFGTFVTGGNVLVGFVVFLILIIIQFIVITKGAERVSEVAARFTLDAMPGKQMAIDADLNAGLISEHEAKFRREKISREADFHGSMDGASKFVKGDAIAGIIIVIINILFGMIIGMLQFDLSLSESAIKFTILTVGDGIVSQIPALLISTATGILVTRSASDNTLGTDIFSQVAGYPKMLYIAATTIFLLGLFTPIHDLLTISIALVFAVGGYLSSRPKPIPESFEDDEGDELKTEQMKSPENVAQLLQIDPIEFEFGYGLIPLADATQGGDLLDRIIMVRRQLAIELGMIMPVVRIRDNIQLAPNEYLVKVKGIEVAKGELLLDHFLVLTHGSDDYQIEGIDTEDPSFGLPAKWVTAKEREKAELLQYTVVDPPSVVSTHITEILKVHAYSLLGRQETKQLIDTLRENHPILVDEVTPSPLTIGDIQKVLSNLLKEKISIRNLLAIFEVLAEYGKWTTDSDVLTEYARQGLSKQISKMYAKEGHIRVVTLSGKLEKEIAENIQQTETGHFLGWDPMSSQKFINEISSIYETLPPYDTLPIILCSPSVRFHVKQVLGRVFPTLPVLSYNELEPNIEVQSVGVVKFE